MNWTSICRCPNCVSVRERTRIKDAVAARKLEVEALVKTIRSKGGQHDGDYGEAESAALDRLAAMALEEK